MAFSDAQNARLQYNIDNDLPGAFLQSDALSICNKLADIFQKGFPGDPSLLAACNGLRLVGKDMNSGDIEPDAPSAEHEFIEGVYSRGGDGYTQFLRAYADAFRKWDDLNVKGTTFWDALTTPETLANAIKDTFKQIGNTVDGAGLGLSDTIKWLVVGVVALFAIVLLVRVGGKAS